MQLIMTIYLFYYLLYYFYYLYFIYLCSELINDLFIFRNLKQINMEWKQECDLLLLQEIVVSEPFKFKSSMRERESVGGDYPQVEWKWSLWKSPGKQKGGER